MTSPAKIRANRRNARKSTGPRTRAGKATVARNALRHGLTLPVLADPTLSREVVDLARAIERSEIGAEADEAGHDLACRIAEAMIDLRRVRLAKLPLVTTLDADPCQIRAWVQLSRLDRYERRTFARRKRAIRAFAEVAVATIGKNLQNKANGETPMNSASAYFRLARPHPEGARAAGASRRMSGRHSGRPHVDKTNPTRKRE